MQNLSNFMQLDAYRDCRVMGSMWLDWEERETAEYAENFCLCSQMGLEIVDRGPRTRL